MITQTLKHWLHKLFAWWPWSRTAQASYEQPIANFNAGLAQGAPGRAQPDGTAPLPSSVAVDHDPDAQTISSPREPVNTSEDRSAHEKMSILPTNEQRLEFLRYLVQQGMLNEGFQEDQVPEQYRRKKTLS